MPLSTTNLLQAFSAADMSNVYQSFDTTLTPVTTDGQNVATWYSYAGSVAGARVRQSTAADKPIYNTGILNAKGGVKYDGTSDHHLFSNALTPANMHESTVHFVISGWTTGTRGLCGCSNTFPDAYYLRTASTTAFELLEGYIASIGTSSGVSALTAGTIVTARLSATGDTWNFRINGRPAGNGAWTGTFAQSVTAFGAQIGTTFEGFDGWIHQAAFYGAVLSDADVLANEQFLSTEWNISIGRPGGILLLGTG